MNYFLPVYNMTALLCMAEVPLETAKTLATHLTYIIEG